MILDSWKVAARATISSYALPETWGDDQKRTRDLLVHLEKEALPEKITTGKLVEIRVEGLCEDASKSEWIKRNPVRAFTFATVILKEDLVNHATTLVGEQPPEGDELQKWKDKLQEWQTKLVDKFSRQEKQMTSGFRIDSEEGKSLSKWVRQRWHALVVDVLSKAAEHRRAEVSSWSSLMRWMIGAIDVTDEGERDKLLFLIPRGWFGPSGQDGEPQVETKELVLELWAATGKAAEELPGALRRAAENLRQHIDELVDPAPDPQKKFVSLTQEWKENAIKNLDFLEGTDLVVWSASLWHEELSAKREELLGEFQKERMQRAGERGSADALVEFLDGCWADLVVDVLVEVAGRRHSNPVAKVSKSDADFNMDGVAELLTLIPSEWLSKPCDGLQCDQDKILGLVQAIWTGAATATSPDEEVRRMAVDVEELRQRFRTHIHCPAKTQGGEPRGTGFLDSEGVWEGSGSSERQEGAEDGGADDEKRNLQKLITDTWGREVITRDFNEWWKSESDGNRNPTLDGFGRWYWEKKQQKARSFGGASPAGPGPAGESGGTPSADEQAAREQVEREWAFWERQVKETGIFVASASGFLDKMKRQGSAPEAFGKWWLGERARLQREQDRKMWEDRQRDESQAGGQNEPGKKSASGRRRRPRPQTEQEKKEWAQCKSLLKLDEPTVNKYKLGGFTTVIRQFETDGTITSYAEMRKAYTAGVLKLHPDKVEAGDEARATTHFQQFQACYEFLNRELAFLQQ
ncbi:unnamed protein product [Amoebophrya sp. A120]|nr:unnamed protein product [Amoebophrya sp. A120]|eukprot:GSA120T00000197001.1